MELGDWLGEVVAGGVLEVLGEGVLAGMLADGLSRGCGGVEGAVSDDDLQVD